MAVEEVQRAYGVRLAQIVEPAQAGHVSCQGGGASAVARPARSLVQELLNKVRARLAGKPTGLGPLDDRAARSAVRMVVAHGVDEDVRVVEEAPQRPVSWGPP